MSNNWNAVIVKVLFTIVTSLNLQSLELPEKSVLCCSGWMRGSSGTESGSLVMPVSHFFVISMVTKQKRKMGHMRGTYSKSETAFGINAKFYL